ncbi:MAG: hypothetical protein HFI90_10935 [Clostridia bacterium]|nr:hypothetical protein [Clostridia bacterium]
MCQPVSTDAVFLAIFYYNTNNHKKQVSQFILHPYWYILPIITTHPRHSDKKRRIYPGEREQMAEKNGDKNVSVFNVMRYPLISAQ